MGENKGFVKTITSTSRCWRPVNVHAPIKDCTEPFFIHYCVFVWTSENDKKKERKVWTRSFGRRKKVSVFKQLRTIIRILYIQTNGKKRCNKKLEVAAVFYILCIFGGENFTLN